MATLQDLARRYLETAEYKMLDVRDGFLLADRLGFGGDRDM